MERISFYLSQWSLAAIFPIVFAIIALLLAQPTHLNRDLNDLNNTMMAVTGTIVALIIPAAGLFGDYILRITNYWHNQIFREKKERARFSISEKTKLEVALRRLRKIQDATKQLVRGALYVVIAFFLSIACACTQDLRTGPCVEWQVGLLFYAAATGFAIIGVVLLLLPSPLLLNRGELSDTIEIFEEKHQRITKSKQLTR
jgi:hypothetical protein